MLRHTNIARTLTLLAAVLLLPALPRYARAQEVRFVQYNSTHALAVPENPAYSFEWTMTWGNQALPVLITSKTNQTENIRWDRRNTYYDVTVYPILDSVGCPGEPVKLKVHTVDYLSLHAFDDVFFTRVNEPVTGDVSENDFDELGLNLIFNPTLVARPLYGTVQMDVMGEFTYTPNPGFTGIDYFVYEVRTDADPSMFGTARVTIVVRNDEEIAELYVEKTGPVKALYGERIQYSIVVKNNGPDPAYEVVLTDSIPFGLLNPQYSLGGPLLPWNDSLLLGDLSAGDSVIVTLTATISLFAPRGIWNQALAYSPIFDTDYTNNDSIWYTQIADIFVTVPDFLQVPGCTSANFPNFSNANSDIAGYEWLPGIGLDDSTLANPLFTPDERTLGQILPYILRITDINGNTAQDTMMVQVTDLPVAQIVNDTLFKNIGENIFISGSESSGDRLTYFWWTGDGNIAGFQTRDSIEIDTTGFFYLNVTDYLGCESFDSVVVLLESHPPVTVSDTVWIVAGSDSTMNVLDNDYDLNGFGLRMTGIVTPPNHGVWSWDDTTFTGNITFMPDIDYWLWDSIEYRVCNDGYPEQCSTGWLFIKCIRPPLNADVAIHKAGDLIAFWGDSIEYYISVMNHGPDTARVTLFDKLDPALLNPVYSVNNGATWQAWRGLYAFPDSLVPWDNGGQIFQLTIRAFIHPEADRYITNEAFIETDIIENKFENDTSRWETKIKQKVIAHAGPDIIIGQCQFELQLDGSESQGENITYLWTPSTWLDNPQSPWPLFTIGETTTYTLTVTDDDGIEDSDSMIVLVLPPPLADAGIDKFLRRGEQLLVGGGNNSGSMITYSWSTPNGRILSGGREPRCRIDTIGTYILTVTDQVGCTDSDTVEVFWYYYPPFPIPDYYSTEISRPVSGNVLYNDYDPNVEENFVLSVSEGYSSTNQGANVYIQSDGSFTFTPVPGFTGIDFFTYEVCNSAIPARCSRGYVEITVNNKNTFANLSVTKVAVRTPALIGLTDHVEFKITVRNYGPDDATGLMITDTLSQYLTGGKYSGDNGQSWRTWYGSLRPGTLAAGDSLVILLRSTLKTDAPDLVFNAVTVASDIFDELFDWDDVQNRNVDTASVSVVTDLMAIAKLVEDFDNDRFDHTIGPCDDLSFLDGRESQSTSGIDFYQWEPGDYLISPADSITRFNHAVYDTTIEFILTVGVGDRIQTASVEVTLSPQVVANAGPDRKINSGQPLEIDATGSRGAFATYEWYFQGQPVTRFANGNPLRPIVNAPGVYTLVASDMHGCDSVDYVTIRENQLYAINDILIVIEGDTVWGNAGINDYDPNGDSIYFKGIVSGPSHGSLLPNPPNRDGSNPYNAWSNVFSSNGSFMYRPLPGYTGFDSFTYEVCDDNDPDLCIHSTVYLKVIDVVLPNSPPVANHDHFFVNMNDTLYSNILANDFDFDGGLIRLDETLIEGVQLGTLWKDTNGNIRYIPFPGTVGTERFTYRIWDNGNPSAFDTATVTIEILKIPEENHKPVAVDDAFFIVGKDITGNLLLNDYDPDSNFIVISPYPVFEPQFGRVEIEQDGTFTYTLLAPFEGTDQFVYKIYELNTEEEYFTTATVYIISLSENRYHTDVAIVKTGPADTLSGCRIQYTLDITIEGPTLANDILVSDTLFAGLTNVEFSHNGGETWRPWTGKYDYERLMLYEQRRILIRATIPDRFSGELPNTAHVSHDMNETIPENNVSTWITDVYQKVIADAGNDTLIGVCDTLFLDGTQSVGMGLLQYRWSPANRLRNPNTARPGFILQPDEVVEFTLVVTSTYRGYTDSDTATVWVQVAPAPKADAGKDQWPESKEVVLLDGGGSIGAGPLKYSWCVYVKTSNFCEVFSTNVAVPVTKTGDYYLTVTDRFGCTDTDLMHVGYPISEYVAVDDCPVVTAQQEPVDIFVLRNDTIDPDDEYELEYLMVIQQPLHGYVIEHPFDSVITYVPDDYFVGYDTFTYIATTRYSNSDDAIVCIMVVERYPRVPEGFSPNGDGINDFLIIENIEKYRYNKLVVFNRWGNIVYEKEKYSNDEPWNGVATKGIRIGSGPLPAGVYLFVLDLGDENKIEKEKRIIKGNIYIASDTR